MNGAGRGGLQERTELLQLGRGSDAPRGRSDRRRVLVSALWDTKEHSDAFGAHIGSVMPIEGGFQGAPEERTATVVNEQAA